MFCKYCGSEISDAAGFCPNCGKSLTCGIAQQQNSNAQNVVKNNKKRMVIAGIVLVLICLFATIAKSAIGVYSDIQSAREAKVYRVISSEKVSKDDVESIVYNLQRRADNYTTEAVVLMKERKSEWYVEISMPGFSDDAYKEVIRNIDLQFIGGYGTDSEEIIVTNQNIKAASVFVVENSATGTKDYGIRILFDDEGTKAFAEGTTKFIGNKISIVLDGNVISEPYVQCAITGGEAQITASSYEEAESIATLLMVGNIGFDLEEVK